MKGHFVTIEGVEGAGKTSLIQTLEALVKGLGYACTVTREPGCIPIAEEIRQVILDPAHTEMDGRTEALLYAAARRQHMVEKILPALKAGHVVICDRFIDSSLAYQGYARGLGIEEVRRINDFAIQGTMPDQTFLLDLDPAEGLKRIAANHNREKNRLDLEQLAFHKRVYEGYRMLAEADPERIAVINAAVSPDKVAAAVYELIAGRLGTRLS